MNSVLWVRHSKTFGFLLGEIMRRTTDEQSRLYCETRSRARSASKTRSTSEYRGPPIGENLPAT